MSVGGSRRTDHAANAGRHAYADRGFDHYPTPQMAVRALLTIEAPLGDILEPCAGRGGITMPLREAGYTVHAFDLFDWGCPDCSAGADFFTTKEAPAGARTAIFNPPFRWAAGFVRHALELVPTVISLQRLAFLESEARSDLIDDGPLARVHIFKKRDASRWLGRPASHVVGVFWMVCVRARSLRQAVARSYLNWLAAAGPRAAAGDRWKRGANGEIAIGHAQQREDIPARDTKFDLIAGLFLRADRRPLLVAATPEPASKIVAQAERVKRSIVL
jgi:hypothetical protein